VQCIAVDATDHLYVTDDCIVTHNTIQFLALVQHLKVFPACVVPPASLKRNWAREVLRWLPGRSVQVLDGSRVYDAAWGLDGALLLTPARDLSADFVIVNYDILSRQPSASRDGNNFRGWVDPRRHPDDVNKKRPRYVAHGVLARYGFRALGFDEGHLVINHKAQRSVAVQALADSMVERHGLDDVVLVDMTGTPFSARAADALKPLQIIHRLDDFGGWFSFATTYCGYADGVMGALPVPPAALEALNAKLRETCYVRRLKKDVLKELPAKVRTTLSMQITNRREYQHAERDVLSWVAEQAAADKEFNASLEGMTEDEKKVARRERAQAAEEKAAAAEHLVRIGALKKLAARGKMVAVKEWVGNFLASGEKIVLGAWHQDIVEDLAAQFDAPYIHGGVPLHARDAAVTAFQRCVRCGVLHDKHDGQEHEYEADMACPVIVVNILSGGVGLTLTAASDMGIIELGWRPKDMDQLEDRIHRIGQRESVNIWYLLAEQTIEEDIAQIIDGLRIGVDAATEGEGRDESPSIMVELLERMAARAAIT
jgi:SWI/SNF-related matrix-associated actin-dependent regulator 1 of chromatin subfamily A